MELVSDDKLAHFGNFIFQDELLKHSIDYYTSTSTSLSLSLSPLRWFISSVSVAGCS